MLIESGPTNERKVRTTLALLLFAVFAVWYTHDGWRGYRRDNLDAFLNKNLRSADERDAAAAATSYATVTSDTLAAAQEAVKSPGSAQALDELYGGPPSHKNADTWYYIGPGVILEFPLRSGRPASAAIVKLPHSETDIFLQRTIAGVLMIPTLVFAIQLIRVVRTRLVLNDAGLSLNGRAPIAWGAMTGLDTDRLKAKGWVDLRYKTSDAERSVRLDEYHYAEFDIVMEAICQRKSFDNPIQRKADAAAEEEAEADAGE